MNIAASLKVSYDRGSDVLYISARNSSLPYHSVENENGIILRYNQQGGLIGVTILDFFDRWHQRRAELTRDWLACSFGIDRSS